jgi:hypothetical protein
MKTFKNQSGSKMVRYSYDYESKVFRAFYLDVYNNEEQLLKYKSFKSENNASKWAAKMLAA